MNPGSTKNGPARTVLASEKTNRETNHPASNRRYGEPQPCSYGPVPFNGAVLLWFMFLPKGGVVSTANYTAFIGGREHLRLLSRTAPSGPRGSKQWGARF